MAGLLLNSICSKLLEVAPPSARASPPGVRKQLQCMKEREKKLENNNNEVKPLILKDVALKHIVYQTKGDTVIHVPEKMNIHHVSRPEGVTEKVMGNIGDTLEDRDNALHNVDPKAEATAMDSPIPTHSQTPTIVNGRCSSSKRNRRKNTTPQNLFHMKKQEEIVIERQSKISSLDLDNFIYELEPKDGDHNVPVMMNNNRPRDSLSNGILSAEKVNCKLHALSMEEEEAFDSDEASLIGERPNYKVTRQGCWQFPGSPYHVKSMTLCN